MKGSGNTIPFQRPNPLAFYAHAGSDNHGCEAIMQSLVDMLEEKLPADVRMTLMTNSAAEDEKYLRSARLDIVEEAHIDRDFKAHVFYYVRRMLTKDAESFLRYRYAPIVGKERAPYLAVSIGGDNYCYPEMVGDLMLANSMFRRQGTKTMLLGCSVEPSLLRGNRQILEDMLRYEMILPRESITYDALRNAGVPEEKLLLCPDPAFALKPAYAPLPEKFETGNTVGINISPMVEHYAGQGDIVLKSYENLIRFILAETGMKIALIPHVVWKRSDDRVPLEKLYREFEDTGRVMLLENRSAKALKACIAACSLFVGARTHATIAAYSSMVPTLVVGYSVKARGIAKDLFGEDDHYVLPVQFMEDDKQLTKDFTFILDNREAIHERLRDVMPFYIKRAQQNAEVICGIMESRGE